MAYTVSAYIFDPPGPSFDLTKHERAIWPKTYGYTANLDDYPVRHEVLGLEFYIDHRLYEGHGTHWNAKYYNSETNRLLFESDFDIPEPSTGGWTYWNKYRIFSWIGHCSWEINEPMKIRVDVTVTSNIKPTARYEFPFTVTSELPGPEECPSFWVDPVGAVICWVASGLEGLLGWTQGSLLTMLGNVWDFFTNSVGAIYDFFADVVGSIVDIVKDNIGSVFDWVTDQFTGFVDWLADIGGDIAGFVTDKISGALDFLTDKIGAFFDWVGELGGSVADYIGGAIGDFVDWSSDQLGSIWDGVTSFFMDAISGFIDAFFGGVNTGIEEAKHSPLHSDEPVRNPVTKGLIKVVREHRKKYNKDEITGANKHGRV